MSWKASAKSNRNKVNDTALTREFKQTMAERGRRDPAFARAMLDEAARVVERK